MNIHHLMNQLELTLELQLWPSISLEWSNQHMAIVTSKVCHIFGLHNCQQDQIRKLSLLKQIWSGYLNAFIDLFEDKHGDLYFKDRTIKLTYLILLGPVWIQTDHAAFSISSFLRSVRSTPPSLKGLFTNFEYITFFSCLNERNIFYKRSILIKQLWLKIIEKIGSQCQSDWVPLYILYI